MSSNSHFNLNLRALCMDGRLKEALHILFTSDNFVKSSTYLQLLQACISKKALSEGKKIHSQISSRGFIFAENPVVQNTLINMYDKCGSLVDARKVFDGMTEPNVFSWNMIVAAYRRHGFPQEAFALFRQMQPTAVKPDEFTFSTILSVCSEVPSVKHGLQIHGKITRCGFQSVVNVVNTLVCMYSKCGNIEKARELFDKMPNIDTVTWNAMITAYAQNAALDEALQLFEEMPQPNLFSWNAIIAGYAQNGLVEKALEMLKQMQYSDVMPNSGIYASILSGCAKMRALEQGMEIHKQIANNRVLPNVMVLNALINMYAKCGCIQKARDLFDNMLQRDVIAWTSIIVGYTQNGLVGNALEFFKEMQLANVEPNLATFSSILTACAKSGALEQGMEIHQKIIESGFLADVVIVNSLIDLYTKCGSIQKAFELFDKMPNADIVSRNAMISGYAQNGFLDEALRIFEEMPQRNVISWTAIIAGCAQNGFVEKALDIFKQMMSTGVEPNSATFASILPACTTIGTLEYGMEIHKKLIESQLLSNVLVSNALIDMYAKCGSVQMAHELFDKMLQRTVASWNAIIAGYAHNGFAEKALEIFKQMQLAGVKPNSATFASILPACSTLGALVNGVEIHQTIMENGFLSDVVVATTLIDMYVKCGRIQKALELFNSMPQRDAASWTAIITGYAQNGLVDKALDIFKQMQLAGVKPDSSTFASILPACTKLGVLEQGMEIHQKIIENDCFCDMVVTALIDMYAKTGSIGKACKLFVKMSQWDVAAWNAMIVGYAQNGLVDDALEAFKQMQVVGAKPDSSTFASMLPACSKLGALEKATEIHQITVKSGFLSDVKVVTALIDMYAKCGIIQKAHKLFNKISQHDVASWNALIGGYAQNGLVEKALEIFKQMQSLDVKPDSSTFVSILPSCAKLGFFDQGMEIHQKIIENGFLSDVVVTALIDMYAKCGSIHKSCELFNNMHHPGVVSWNAMIAGYAMHGYSMDALKLFELMKQSGVNPDHVSFICVFFACCHAGVLDDGCKFFYHMSDFYGIKPRVEHYVCIVDLLSRAGHLEETLNFIIKMPIKPDVVAWMCLLGACRSHKNIELGEFVGTLVFELDPQNAAPYVLLSNINAEAGRWSDAQKLRKLMKDRGVVKKPGCSWIEVHKRACVQDRSYPQTQEMYSKLEKLSWETKTADYLPDSHIE